MGAIALVSLQEYDERVPIQDSTTLYLNGAGEVEVGTCAQINISYASGGPGSLTRVIKNIISAVIQVQMQGIGMCPRALLKSTEKSTINSIFIKPNHKP